MKMNDDVRLEGGVRLPHLLSTVTMCGSKFAERGDWCAQIQSAVKEHLKYLEMTILHFGFTKKI